MKAFSNFHIMSNYIKQIKLDAKVQYFLELQFLFLSFSFKRRKPSPPY